MSKNIHDEPFEEMLLRAVNKLTKDLLTLKLVVNERPTTPLRVIVRSPLDRTKVRFEFEGDHDDMMQELFHLAGYVAGHQLRVDTSRSSVFLYWLLSSVPFRQSLLIAETRKVLEAIPGFMSSTTPLSTAHIMTSQDQVKYCFEYERSPRVGQLAMQSFQPPPRPRWMQRFLAGLGKDRPLF